MNSNSKAPMYIIITLAAIGVISMISSNPWALVTPIAVFGIIYLLYKFPPRFQPKRASTPPPVKKYRKSKSRAKLHVIDGTKSMNDEDDKPKYH